MTKGSPLLCSGCLPPWFAPCSARICIGWPTCRFSPPPFPSSPSLPSSHHLRLVSPEPALVLSFSLSLSLLHSLFLLLFPHHSLSPSTPPSRSLPAVSHFHILFFLPGFSLFFICLQISLFLLWSNTKSYQAGSPWVNKPDHFSSQGIFEKKRRKSWRKSREKVRQVLDPNLKMEIKHKWGSSPCVEIL